MRNKNYIIGGIYYSGIIYDTQYVRRYQEEKSNLLKLM